MAKPRKFQTQSDALDPLRISTSRPYPGVWLAVDDDTYDCDCDQDGFFSVAPIGQGDTEAAAIEDLLEQIEDAQS